MPHGAMSLRVGQDDILLDSNGGVYGPETNADTKDQDDNSRWPCMFNKNPIVWKAMQLRHEAHRQEVSSVASRLLLGGSCKRNAQSEIFSSRPG